MLTDVECITQIENNRSSTSTAEYSIILQNFNLEYKIAGYCLQVGEITKTQGWIIHLSVILSQIQNLLEKIIPILLQEKVAFKIVKDFPTAGELLTGHFGLSQIGKIISIYPETDTIAIRLAKELVHLTSSYKGPFIPTDACLGGVVFTRYGSFNPIIKTNENGTEQKYIYNEQNQLIKDSYSIPFRLPNNIQWPFKDISDPVLPNRPKLLNRVYKPLHILKADPRGNVFKGLYVKSFFQVKHCVIKQGISNMNSDLAGRDIQDRLIWQNELSKELSDIARMPVIYDLFQEEGSTVLVMEFVKGRSLLDQLAQDNPLSKSWQTLPLRDSLRFLQYAIEITKIIDQIHKKGYVHRDIVPVNFLIDRQDRITLIDVELAYSLSHNKPNPPFSMGTVGFMSPEQMALKNPTEKEDTYGLGATLLYTLTGIVPIKFNTADTEDLLKNLYFLIGNKEISKIVALSLHHDLNLRPNIRMILEGLMKYQTDLKTVLNSQKPNHGQTVDSYKLTETIKSALKGLVNPPIIISNDLWCSKHLTIENFTSNKNCEYTVSPGISEGLAGVLYVLARIHKTGIIIDPCKKAFDKGWKYLEDNYFNRLSEKSPGLYKGAAGLALALAEGIRSGLIDDAASNRERIQMCLRLPCEKLDLANGIAGQGLCHLLCKDILKEEDSRLQLAGIVRNLIAQQNANGSWLEGFTSKINETKFLDIGYDGTGVIWFLLKYISIYPDREVQNAVTYALDQMSSNKRFLKCFDTLVASKESYEMGDGGKGLILLFIKAYEVFQEYRYRKLAEIALSKYPPEITHSNFSQQNGLAGVGELYLEAWQAFKNEEWKQRADWIANVFMHTIFRKRDGSGHWVMEQNNPPTADFLTGNGGILHFLVRCLDSHSIGHRLLN